MSRGYQISLVTPLTLEEGQILIARQRSTTIRIGLAKRGHIILIQANGASISSITRTVGSPRYIERLA